MGSRLKALAAYRARSYGCAELHCRRALRENPGDSGILHLLGVVHMEQKRYREALDFLWDAAERTGWSNPKIRLDLSIALARRPSPGSHELLLKLVLEAGRGAMVPVSVLRGMAAAWRKMPAPSSAPIRASMQLSARPRTAIIVLGMHRSGTSALARVINLCGGFLPARVLAAAPDANPTGFWEPQEVFDLNAYTLGRLGGDWDRVGFSLPASGPLQEEFARDACTVLASEYAEQDTILIKDPRICVLAPWWHAALLASGYRPVYVVPVRNPVEVAQSLQARGDMTAAQGLALWLAYMRRVAQFTEARKDVALVTYTDLLDDWREVIGQVNGKLGIALDPVRAANEVDSFLEPGLHRQNGGMDLLGGLAPAGMETEIRALYQACMTRCERDRRTGRHLPGHLLAAAHSAAPAAAAGFMDALVERRGHAVVVPGSPGRMLRCAPMPLFFEA